MADNISVFRSTDQIQPPSARASGVMDRATVADLQIGSTAITAVSDVTNGGTNIDFSHQANVGAQNIFGDVVSGSSTFSATGPNGGTLTRDASLTGTAGDLTGTVASSGTTADGTNWNDNRTVTDNNGQICESGVLSANGPYGGTLTRDRSVSGSAGDLTITVDGSGTTPDGLPFSYNRTTQQA